MILEHLDILNFKNIGEASLTFSPGVNCFVGRNGMGKSNLLEAIYFLSLARPMQSMPETALLRHGSDQLLTKGRYRMDSGVEENVSMGITRGKGKKLLRNGKEYGRLSEHIGRFPLVAATPADSQLVTGSGELRRRLLDMVISQTDSGYLSQLIRYNRALDSRNRMLRGGMRDKLLYESVEQTMAASAEAVNRARREWTSVVAPILQRYYEDVSGGAEKVSLSYRSGLNDSPLQELLESSRQRDTLMGFTTVGVHRDDLDMELNGHPLKRVGSQGQMKSFVIALRLAIYSHLREKSGMWPILLLDDIFDKLDADRVAHIVSTVSSGEGFGQIFITDTNRQHLDETIATLAGESALFDVCEGNFSILNVE